MNWNAKPESSPLPPPPYPKSQSSILQQFLILQPPTTSQSSFSYPANNQESCMYSSNSNSGLQPLLNVRNYTPQISVSNMHNRTVVASQTSVDRIICTNVKGLQQPNHSLQTVSSGVVQNVWLNSPVRNSMPSHTEAAVPQQTNFGTSVPYIHAAQNQLVTSDTYSVQLQMTPSNSVRGPVTFQGNQGLNHSVPDQLVDWAQQYTSSELTYPDYRPPPKQYSYSPQNFLQDPSVQKQNFIPSTSFQVKNNQPPASVQNLHSKHPAPVSSYQYAGETSKRLPALPYNCRYGTQPMQNSQPVAKHFPVEVPRGSEMQSSEKRKDTYKGFQQQWQNASENISNIGNFCDLKINTSVKQSHNEPVSSPKDGVQTLAQNNQEKRMYSYNPSANQVLDTNVTKEKLVRDIKSLVEIKKKFSELARKIKINKELLMAAGCSKTANAYPESAQHSEFSTKEVSAKSDKPCSMELLATCLSLWKNQQSETAEERVPKSSEEKLCSVSRTSKTSTGSSNPVSEVHVKSFCAVGGSSQKKMANLSQETVPVVPPTYESSGVAAAKGTELQIAVVSPLILSSVRTLRGEQLVPEALPEPVYPVVKEDSVCSLQDQLTKNTAVIAALNIGKGTVADSATSDKVSPSVQKEKQHTPTQSDPDTAGGSQGKHSPPGEDALPNPGTSTVASGPMLQIESICSLAEGDTSYNSQIAEIFNSLPLKNDLEKLPLLDQQVIGNQQEEQVDHNMENKDFGFQKDKCVQCTDVPHEVTEQPKPLQPPEPASYEDVEANRELIEKSNLEHATEKESTTKDVCCSPAAIQQDPHPQETDACSSNSTHDPATNEIHDEDPPASYLHDQLSELLKEFPYGIEAVTRHEVSVGQQKTDQILENQTGGKTGHVSEDCTDQIKITILNSDQIKELFPEDDQPCKLAEPEKKTVAEGRSLCDSQAPRGESHDPGMLDSEKDKIHCCALGWLSMVYEGVPQCQCSSVEEKGKGQGSLEINSCRQGEKLCSPGITIFEINTVSNTPGSALTQAAEKGDFPEIHDKIKTPETKENSSPKVEQESAGQLSVECFSKDEKDASKIKQDISLKMGQKITSDISSKCVKPNPVKSNKTKKSLTFHVISFNSYNNMPAFSEQARLESQRKHLGPGKALRRLLPDKDSSRRNVSLVQSASPEKKKLKFKAGGSRLKYFEKRKIDHVIIPDMEVKKKKYEKQEQNKNAGGTLPLCSTLTNPNEGASGKERTVSSAESSDLKTSSSKSTRVITLQEYLQRQKNKQMMVCNASKNVCVENVLCDSEHLRPSKHAAPGSWGKLMGMHSGGAETSKEPVRTFTSHGKNHSHHSEESRSYNVSRNSKGKVDRKHLDKASIDKTKIEKRLGDVNNEVESSQMPSQAKQQRKLYLNRVAFKCTERESICLTKLDSASQKLSKEDEKSQEYMPKTKDATDKPSMLEFKLCPDMLLKNTSSFDKQDDPMPGLGKEQAPVQGPVWFSSLLFCDQVSCRWPQITISQRLDLNSEPLAYTSQLLGSQMCTVSPSQGFSCCVSTLEV
uniref:Retroelement silencing factor 1 n=1 Tax=Nannospalax galili TaxID=1026970 RepID=A0A8C6QWM6_NANGA